MNSIANFLMENKQIIRPPRATGSSVVKHAKVQAGTTTDSYKEKMSNMLPKPNQQSLSYTHTPADDALKLYHKLKKRV